MSVPWKKVRTKGYGTLAYPLTARGYNLGGVAGHRAAAKDRGMSLTWKNVNAVDIVRPARSSVFAVESGIIVKSVPSASKRSNVYGWQITVRSLRDPRRYWYYTHVTTPAVTIRIPKRGRYKYRGRAVVGKVIYAGTRFTTLENTSAFSPHLHIAVTENVNSDLFWRKYFGFK